MDFLSRGQSFQSQGLKKQTRRLKFQSQGLEFQSQGLEFQSQGLEFQSAELEGTSVVHYPLPFSLIHLTHGRKTWLKGLKTCAHARVLAYAHT